MEIINSYNCKITNGKDIFKPTITIFRDALFFIINVVNKEWSDYTDLKNKEKVNFTEKLIHETKDNSNPKYKEFDDKFYKFPSYLRRDVISQAIGIVSSFKSNLGNYEEERHLAILNGENFKKQKPKLRLKHFKCPSLFKGNMYERISDNEVKIKIFHQNDWVWFNCKLRQQDVNYIIKHVKSIDGIKELSPTLCNDNRKFSLKFGFKRSINLPKIDLKDRVVISVDLGMNTTAVCSAINAKGTVLDRLFINQSKEKDLQRHLLNKTCKMQQLSSYNTKMKSLWRKINNLNTEISNDTVSKILNFAIKNGAYVIVFEHLGHIPTFKSIKNKKRRMQKQMWIYKTIQNKVEQKAHSIGIRFSRINPKNTSALAFDGSGKTKRDSSNFSNCTFATGKKYNCDLNASYNIGARYFIREILQSSSVKKKSELEAKVPEVRVRTNCVLSTLISIAKVM